MTGLKDSTRPAVDPAQAKAILAKYEEERLKRIRKDGANQFIVSSISEKYGNFDRDIWVDDNAVDPGANCITDGSRHEYIIAGAGYGGLLAAVRLIEVGVDPNDIRFVDSAGGFGGTWWYNRYPGLMCDVESYIYMPLLEELEYMPKHKYSYGPELRQHAVNIAERWDLLDKALFQARIISMDWSEADKEWIVKIKSSRKGEEGKIITTRSRYGIIAGGTVDSPKLPRLEGFDQLKAHTFHTSRWDWKYTGGTEEEPAMTNLKDKTVAILGTGATAIQVVPHLAKWAKHLYVFQRTPSAVDERGQQETSKEWWDKEIRGRKGWQRERRINFSAIVANADPKPEVDLVQDGWTSFPSYSAGAGNEQCPTDPAETEAYVEQMVNLDLVRQSAVRDRVDTIVKDKKTAAKLKAWYAGWCKRPCFHDDYLPAFNRPNVTLVDTDGKGVDRMTENGLVFEGKEYPVDVLVLSTGYEIPLTGTPASKYRIDVRGVNGTTFDQEWAEGCKTLHGIQTNGFPNLFWLGLSQTGATPNQVAMIDELSRHIAFIVSEATRKYNSRVLRIQPTVQAQEEWAGKILANAFVFATTGICPPSYFNAEGDLYKLAEKGIEEQTKLASTGFWPRGLNDFLRVIENWRAEQPLEGFDIEADQEEVDIPADQERARL